MAEVRIERGGPMTVRGAPLGRLRHVGDRWAVEPIDVDDGYAICRCGRSSTMPLCDRTDASARCFDELPADAPPPGPFRWDVPDPAGPPAVALKPDGPARVVGAAISYEREQIEAGDRVSLCRCGASRCQPLCDSSHKASGFRG